MATTTTTTTAAAAVIEPTSATDAPTMADDDDDADDSENTHSDSAFDVNEVIDFDSITTAPIQHHMERQSFDGFIPMTVASQQRIKRGASAELNNVVHRVSVLVHNITLVSENDEHQLEKESLVER